MPKHAKSKPTFSVGKKQTVSAPSNTNASGYVPGTMPSFPFLGSIGNGAALQLMGQADSDIDEDEWSEDESDGEAAELDDEGSDGEEAIELDDEEAEDDNAEWEDQFAEEQYEEYMGRKEDGEARDYVQETLDYDSSDNESEMEEGTFLGAMEQIFSVMNPYPDVDELKTLSDRVAEDKEDGDDIGRETFEDVGKLHDNRDGVVSVRDNPVLFAAHRDIIPIKSARKAKSHRIPLKYPDYRKKFNKSVPKAAKYLMKRNNFRKKILAKKMQAKHAKAFEEMLSSGSLDLRNANDKPPALEHKINKAGKQGFPIGQVRSRNLVLVNDDRKYDEGPHPMMHSIKAAEGSDKTNYSKLDDDAGGAIAFGIRRGIERRRLEKEEEQEEKSDF